MKISGAEVAIPIIKKLEINPEILYKLEKRSVELTRKFEPNSNNINPASKNNIASVILDRYYMKYSEV